MLSNSMKGGVKHRLLRVSSPLLLKKWTHGHKGGGRRATAALGWAHLNYGQYAEQRGALVFIHGCWGNKTEAFEELVGICAGGDPWGV